MSLKFKFSENNSVIKEINGKLESLEDSSEYRKVLKTVQKDVNEYLTGLVNASSEASEVVEREEDLSDTDSEEEKVPKRNLSEDRTSQKTKVKKHS